jgi:hypothetical protein
MASWTQADLAALEAAIAKGVLIVEYNDKRVRYRSLDEMLKIRDLMLKSLGLAKKPSRIFVETSKGIK